MLSKAKLKKFCDEKGIYVPSGASLEYLNAAIVRSALHRNDQTLENTCFGFWENDNSTCMVCDFQERCFEASIGMPRDEYFKKLENSDKPKVRHMDKRLVNK